MVSVKEIKRVGDTLVCNVYVEDCTIPIPAVYDIKTGELERGELPAEYWCCREHFAHARKALSEMVDLEEFPPVRTVMWY